MIVIKPNVFRAKVNYKARNDPMVILLDNLIPKPNPIILWYHNNEIIENLI